MWDLWAAMWSDPVSLTTTEKTYSKLLFRNSFELRVLAFFPQPWSIHCNARRKMSAVFSGYIFVGYRNVLLPRFWPNWNMQFAILGKVWILDFISRLSMIVQLKVVLKRTVIVDSDWRFDNLCGQIESKWVDGIKLFSLLSNCIYNERVSGACLRSTNPRVLSLFSVFCLPYKVTEFFLAFSQWFRDGHMYLSDHCSSLLWLLMVDGHWRLIHDFHRVMVRFNRIPFQRQRVLSFRQVNYISQGDRTVFHLMQFFLCPPVCLRLE